MTRAHSTALLVRLGLLLVLLFAQHGALLHAYSHFGLVPDPYAAGEGRLPPAQGCDLGVVHAALDGDLPSAAALCAATFAVPASATLSLTAFTPLSLRPFHSRAPPARA
jgi:hypothetical protein